MSAWHYKAYGAIPPSADVEPAVDVLARVLDEHTTYVTGAALKNLGATIARLGDALRIGRHVCQGGFAGEGVVPPERQLAKFRGRTTCPSFNLNGDVEAVFAALGHRGIAERRFVSKNVCHGVIYDHALHERVGAVVERSRSLQLIHQGMTVYLRDHRGGKAFHDPLAACCAIDGAIGEWAEVEIYRERGEWGARLAAGTATWIITGYDRARFEATLLAC